MAFTTSTLAQILNVSTSMITASVYNGQLKSEKRNGKHYITVEDAANWIGRNIHYRAKLNSANPPKRYQDSYHILKEKVDSMHAPIYSSTQVHLLLDASSSTIHKYMSTGVLKAEKSSVFWFIYEPDFIAFLKSHPRWKKRFLNATHDTDRMRSIQLHIKDLLEKGE